MKAAYHQSADAEAGSYSDMSHPHRQSVMQVGKYYPPHVGGIETHLEALCRELRNEMDVSVLVANTSARTERCVVDGVAVTRSGRHFTIAGAPVCPSMAWQIRKRRPDIVHLHLPNPTGALAVSLSGYRGPVVVSWHSDIVRQLRLAKIYHPIQRILLRNCAAIVSATPNYIESSDELSRMKSRCRVIPYGIDYRSFRTVDPDAVALIRRKFGPRIVLAVGRLVYYKGFEHAVRAMARVDANLVVIGDGPLRQHLEEKARELGVADRVFFLGEVGKPLSPYYHACDVFILPSVARSEAFGIVQLEAMACGKPVVNTYLESGVPFVSIDGQTGITVPPGSPDALASAVNLLLDDPALAAAYGDAAARRVQTEFSLDAMVRRTLDVYGEVSEHGRAAQFASNGASRAPQVAVR